MKNKLYKNILLVLISVGFVACEDYVDYEASEGYTIVAGDYFTKASD